MKRFQTNQGKSYRVYVGGDRERVEFIDGIAQVSDATAAKLREDPLNGREYFEVTDADVAEAREAIASENGGDPDAEAKAAAEAKSKVEAEADTKAKPDADDRAKNPKKNGK